MMVLILFSEDSGLRVGLLFLALYHSVLAFFFLPSDVGPYSRPMDSRYSVQTGSRTNTKAFWLQPFFGLLPHLLLCPA